MQSHPSNFTAVARFVCAARRSVALFVAAALSSCATNEDLHSRVTSTQPELAAKARSYQEIADTHWEYAALAADVYATRGISETLVPLSHASPLTRAATERTQPELDAAMSSSPAGDIERLSEGQPIQIDDEQVSLKDLCRFSSLTEKTDEERCAALMPAEYQAFLALKKAGRADEYKEKAKQDNNETNSVDRIPASLPECDIFNDQTRGLPCP